ncbi:MAG TPA: glycosyltransferase [Actinomycetes bacterium]|nr:glycosyltransferase [Actinomycetes bacterium]
MSPHSTRPAAATRNRAAELEATLERLHAFSGHVPIVVVDNASEDGTAPRVRRRHPQVQVLELRENLGAAARTIGAFMAASPYVVRRSACLQAGGFHRRFGVGGEEELLAVDLAATVVEAVRGLPWVVRARRPVPQEVEADLRRLGRGGASGASAGRG